MLVVILVLFLDRHQDFYIVERSRYGGIMTSLYILSMKLFHVLKLRCRDVLSVVISTFYCTVDREIFVVKNFSSTTFSDEN